GKGGFTPAFVVYEVSEDPDGNPILLEIARRDNAPTPPKATQLSSTFSVTGPPRTSGSTGLTHNNYYVVVKGADPDVDQGQYDITLNVAALDDHPDAGQWTLADPILLGPGTGQGNAPGTINFTGDTDLFQFSTLAQGQLTITLTSPDVKADGTGNTLRPR